MKRLLIPPVLSVIVAASTAFGQAYIDFGGGSRTVWNGTGYSSVYGTITGPTTDSGFDATFLWSANATTSPMPIASTPTNCTTFYSFAAAWAAIGDAGLSGWTIATSGGTNIVGTSANNVGSFSADSGSAVPLDGGSSVGQTIDLFAVAWETEGGLYTTLAAAQAAGAPLGWSSVFQYTLGSGPPATPPAETVIPKFGIGTPEPTTLALAGLGGLSMLFLRRRKS